MRKRYWIELIILGLVFMGVSVHMRPTPRDVVFLDSPSQKAEYVNHHSSQSLLDRFARRFSSNPGFPTAVIELQHRAAKSTSIIEHVKLLDAVRDPEDPIWRDLTELYNESGMRRAASGDGGEITPFEPMDQVFTSDIRVNNPYSTLQYQPDFTVGTDGTVYAVWGSDEPSEGSICFSKSTDGGATWEGRTVVDSWGVNIIPSIAAYGSGATARIYLTYTWLADYENYNYHVYCSYSTNGGSSWSLVGISTDGFYSHISSAVVDNLGYIYVVYTYADWSTGSCDDGDVDYHVYYKYSATSGSTWSGALLLVSSGNCMSGLPAVAVESGGANAVMHLAYVYDYSCGGSGDYDVRYRKFGNVGVGSPSTIYGDRWIAATTGDEYVIPNGLAVGSDGDPQIVYNVEAGSDSGSIYYKRSNDGGNTFGAAVAVSNGSWYEIDPVIALDTMDNPAIAWRDHRYGDGDIYFTWSPDGGSSFVTPREVDKEVSSADQFWPCICSFNSSCTRHFHFGWWDARYDEGDIYYNGNEQYQALLHVTFPTGIPPSLPHFIYHEFDEAKDSTIYTAGDYAFWYDPEYTASTEPLLDQLLGGSTSTERWACDNPGGWTLTASDDWWGNGACGEFNVAYFHQVYMTFAPTEGNPAGCTHTIPSITIRYYNFGALVDTFGNEHAPVTDWVDYGSDYTFRGWVDISPHERWAITSADTLGTAHFPGTIEPVYYHQWLPHIFFAGTDAGNFTWTTIRTYLGYSLLDSDLITDWQDWVDCGTILAFSESTSTGKNAINDYDTLVIDWIPSYTIIYSTDAYVTIQTDFGTGTVKLDGILYSSPHTELLAPGTEHTIEAPTPQTFDDTVQYHFSSWTDGPTDTVRTITVPSSDVTYTAQYDRWFKIVTGYTGSTGGHIPVLTGDGWYQEGTWAGITATEGFDSTEGIRYGFSHWESTPPGATFLDPYDNETDVLVDYYYQVTAVYSVQYSLEIQSDYGDPNPPVGFNWYDAGASVTAAAGSPDTISHMYCSGFLASGSGLPASGTADSIYFTITEPTWVRWLWTDQIWLFVISSNGFPNPPTGVNYYDPGADVTATVDSIHVLTPNMRELCIGYTGTDGIGSGGDNDVNFIITQTCTLTWNWQTQYTFEVINPGGHDAPVPPASIEWYNAGSDITAYVTSPAGGYVCIGYYGTGSVPVIMPYDSTTFTLDMASSIEWRWALSSDVVILSVFSTDGNGDPFPFGTTYWVIGTPITAYVTSPYYDSYPAGIRDSCTGFTASGSPPSSGTNDTVNFTINVNSTINWSWIRQYMFTVNNPLGYDTPDPIVGFHWFNTGATVDGSVTSPWEDSIVCTGYDGEGSLPDGSNDWFSFVIDTPSTVTWFWDVNNVILTVVSDYGTPDPTVGDHTYLAGADVHCEVDSVIYGSGERWVCTGWIGSGSVPATGDSNSLDVTLTEDSQIEWTWKRELLLIVDDGGHGAATPPDGNNWFDEGAEIECSIAPNPDDTFFCVGYTGTGSVGSEWGYDHTSITLDEPSSITWIWLGAGSVSALVVSTDYGEPYPDPGVHYYPNGTGVDAYMPDASDSLGDGERRHCTGYSGTGSVPSGADTSVSFTINENSTLDWNWAIQFRLTIENPDGWDTPAPSAGDHWYDDGSVITASVTPVVDSMRCIGYYGTGSVPASGWGSTVTFTLTMPSSLEWRWLHEDFVCELMVISAHGHPNPPAGLSFIPCGQSVVATVEQVDTTMPGSGWYCAGWSGIGSVPPSGDTNFVVFTLNETSFLTWLWDARHELVLTYAGDTGGEIPIQTGGGWYAEDETVTIYTEPELFDGSEHYGFMGWECRGGSIWIEHPEFFETIVEVSQPCTLVANYGDAVACTLAKSPFEIWGGFIVDGIEYLNISVLTFWWGRGSSHLIEATDPDVSPDSSSAYGFSHWSDAGDREHWVEASASFILYAYYDELFKAHFIKEPPEDFGTVRVDGDVVFGHEWTGWFEGGSIHTVFMSTPDVGPGIRYDFDYWSDFDSSWVRDFGPITEPLELTAFYNGEVEIAVTKDPLEAFGSITINDSIHDSVASISEWVEIGTIVDVAVSRIDVNEAVDTAYIFTHWDDDLSDSLLAKALGAVTEGVNLTAHYVDTLFVLEFFMFPDEWDLDTLNRSETRTMETAEVIQLLNTGTIPIDFGLETVEFFTSWSAGVWQYTNIYVLRAEFDQNPTPPYPFNPSYDYVKNSIEWSTEDIFGPMGFNNPPGIPLNLWLQFNAPTSTYDYTRQTIILQVVARPTIY